jgi:AI-2 transport protein TqsA
MNQAGGISNRTYITAGIWIIATAAIGMVLHEGASILAPFALAIFVWLVMEGFSREIRRRVPRMPDWIAHAFAMSIVAVGIILFISVLRTAIMEFARNSSAYETSINRLIQQVYAMLQLQDAPTLSTLVYSDATVGFIEPAVTMVRGLASDIVIIAIYVAFLYVTAATFSRKLDNIFPRPVDRERARRVGAEIRRTMEQYLWVQTALSIITTSLTYITLLVMGLDNAQFWALVIFILNYIPTIGSIIAGVLPALFAVAQPIESWPIYMPEDPLWCAAIVFLGVSFWQFVIGNFLGPRMTSNSLNLSALVVLLSLAVWGALWGLPGMFLSAPLTVLIMIVLAQIPGARWIAVLLSADGNPGDYAIEQNEPAVEKGHEHVTAG